MIDVLVDKILGIFGFIIGSILFIFAAISQILVPDKHISDEEAKEYVDNMLVEDFDYIGSTMIDKDLRLFEFQDSNGVTFYVRSRLERSNFDGASIGAKKQKIDSNYISSLLEHNKCELENILSKYDLQGKEIYNISTKDTVSEYSNYLSMRFEVDKEFNFNEVNNLFYEIIRLLDIRFEPEFADIGHPDFYITLIYTDEYENETWFQIKIDLYGNIEYTLENISDYIERTQA